MRKFYKSAFALFVILAICLILTACQPNSPIVPPVVPPESTDVTTQEIDVVRQKAMEAKEKFHSYSSFTADCESGDYKEQASFAKYAGYMWNSTSYEEVDGDNTITQSETFYYHQNSYVRYRKYMSKDYREEKATYISAKIANEESSFTQTINQAFDLFEAKYVDKTKNQLNTYYGDSIPFSYNLSYVKQENLETITANTMFVDTENFTCPVIMLNATITLSSGAITNFTLSTSINDKCMDRDNEDYNNIYKINLSSINETTIAKPALSELATEEVSVDFYLGDTLINSREYELDTSLISADIIQEYNNNGYFNDALVSGLKLKGHPALEEIYVLSEKKSYEFEFILDEVKYISYVSNMDNVNIGKTYFSNQASPNFGFDESQKIINGKSFIGWYEDSNLTIPAEEFYLESTKLYGKWADAKYITMIAKGVNNLYMPKITVNSGLHSIIGFERDAKFLDGFYTDEAMLNKFDISQGLNDTITTLYANFSNGVFVTFDIDADIPNDFSIDNYLSSDIASIAGKTIVVNTKVAEIRGESFINIVNNIQRAIDERIDTFGSFSSWIYNNASFTPTENYPQSSITLKANYEIPLSVKINFGSATINNEMFGHLLDYIYANGVYTIKLQDILDLGNGEFSYEDCLKILFTKFMYFNAENEPIQDYMVFLPEGKAFFMFATDSLGENIADLTLAPTENSDDVLYLILKNEEVVTINVESEVFGTSFAEFYNQETNQYVINSGKYSVIYNMEQFINLLKSSYTKSDFDYFTTDENLTEPYTIQEEWETVSLYVKFAEMVELTLYMGSKNMNEMMDIYYDEQGNCYILETRADSTQSWDMLFMSMQYAVVDGTLIGFTEDVEGLIDFDGQSVPPWRDLTLYAKYES